MDPFHFACPHCSSRLRVREQLYVGRQIDCPECGQALKVVEGKEGLETQAIERLPTAKTAGQGKPKPQRKPSAEKPAPAGAPQPVAAAPRPVTAAAEEPASTPATVAVADPASAEHPALPRWRRPPVLIGTSAGIVVFLLLAAFLYPRKAPDHPPDDAFRNVEPPAVANHRPESELPAGSPERNPEKPKTDLELRLTKIGEALLDVAESEGAFPRGTVEAKEIAPENRLSWLARLADQFDDDAPAGGEPRWDLPWDNPRNESFVRRRLRVFQNPAISQLTGADGYPAGHFVGVAGVGANAARLEGKDARAGIFGYDRRTKLEEIPDGSSNTMLVLGVNDHLGSWAAGGPATVRGLAREPYINGPDGFGTGSADSMQVLMADGRVVTLSARTDPRLLRRMAAKADGLPLDEAEPGEPGDQPSLLALKGDDGTDETEAEKEQMADDAEEGGRRPERENRPLDPEIASEPEPAQPKIDLAVSLKQPIAKFDQPKSKPLSDVLTSVAEMAGARITYDRDELGPAAARLGEPVALKLENTTVGEILSGLLHPVGLDYRVEGDHLKLVPHVE